MMYDVRSLWLAVLLISVPVCAAQPQGTPEPAAASAIPESKITVLEAELAKKKERTSSVRRRMTCKSVIREGQSLLEAYPAAPNRYRVLGIVFQGQKRLLGLKNSDRNREALFDTCKELAQAPDAYAGLRLEADLLLSDRVLTAKDATLAERAKALAALVERYRGTSAEAKSLMMAYRIAPKLEAFDLQEEIRDALSKRFADDPVVIEFIKKNVRVRLDVLFSGTFTRLDGTVLRFPADRLGHLCIMVFWSQRTPGFQEYLKQIKEQKNQYPDRFEVFSFNLDELPDGGKAILRELDLDWTIMRLPGGRKSQTFRTYVRKDPLGILVNAYGHAVLEPTVIPKVAFTIGGARVSSDRYLAQLQSLFIGDFLVTDTESSFDPSLPPELRMISLGADAQPPAGLKRTSESVPAKTLRAIQACFTPPPFRYRLTTAEALAKYTKAEKLCRGAIAKYPAAPDLWLVRNRRIVALMGMWNLAAEPKHLESAVREARAALAATLPPGAGVVPRFCLARDAIRRGDSEPRPILSAFIKDTGGPDAPGSALAAVAILALAAHEPDLHNRYRGRLLEVPDDGNPMLWSVSAFLRDRYHRYRLFKGNYIRPEDRGVRSYVVAHGAAPTTDRLPELKLKTPDGRALNLPRDTDGELTLLLFVEPPADKTETKLPNNLMAVMKYATTVRDKHIHKKLNLIAAFLGVDAERVDAVMKANDLTCRAAMVPGGLGNPMVRRLGIFSADRIPNVFLLRRDGTIAWHTSGFSYKADFGYPFAIYLAMKVHIEVCEVEFAYNVLEKGDFQEAARVFSGPFLPWRPDRYGWRSPRYHGKALALMGMKDWESALEAIDVAIDAHKLRHYHYKGRTPKPANWRKGLDEIKIKEPCDVFSELWTTKAVILEQLGRKEEADAVRKRSEETASEDSPNVYKRFHERLKAFRLGQKWE